MKLIKASVIALAIVSGLGMSTSVMSESTSVNQTAGIDANTLNTYFSQLNKHDKYLGSVAVYKKGVKQYQNTLTLNDNGEAVHSDQTLKYRVGSITKTFTSVLVFKLIEESKLTLNTKLSDYFPNIINADKITIKQMLSHTSGIKSFTTDPRFLEIMYSKQNVETMVRMVEGYESLFEPGSNVEYSNSNYYLLGQIIERVTGKSYQANLEKYITNKLGLTDTYFGGSINPDAREVYSYGYSEDKWSKDKQSDMSIPHGAGSIVSSTHDLSVFIHALFDGQLVNEASLASMLETKKDFGKGIFKQRKDDTVLYGHDGAIDNFVSSLTYDIHSGTSVSVLLNGANISPAPLSNALFAAANGEEVVIPNFNYLALSEAELEKFAGFYTSDTAPMDLTVYVEDASLMLKPTGQGAFPVSAKSANEFELADYGISVVFDTSERSFVIKQGPNTDKFVWSKPYINKTVDVAVEVLKGYEGTYSSPTFPLDLKVFVKDGKLMAQATGQGAFLLSASSPTTFTFNKAGIEINFDAASEQLTLSQGGRDTLMTKS
ncbi:serine hydrolase [Veronia nyctiphanis]|uniref:Serine hydrolase n=1 Tax=Veronia nyctiphanis TaxID=1278244 RepID=A0A4Q0YTS0_9GAMM|nr:serine hydrolase domain-containing protein [Veronia nyctiphanis]RXJ74640.1 serine hydrolase [Veronia nyctiphanis]